MHRLELFSHGLESFSEEERALREISFFCKVEVILNDTKEKKEYFFGLGPE